MKDKIIQIINIAGLHDMYGLSESGKLYYTYIGPDSDHSWKLVGDSPVRELPAPVEEVEEIEELNETSIYEKVDELLNELVPDLASKVKIKSLVVGYTNRINQLVREFNKLQKGV